MIRKAWQAHKMSFQSQPSINSFFRQLTPQESADKCLYAQNVAHVCLQHQNKKKWKLAWTCNGPFWQITGPFPLKQCISCSTDGPFPKNFLKIN
jgi:hypothetical protein